MITESELEKFYHNLDRALFIDNENKKYAYYDDALPIGYGQTISQPSLVFEMTLRLKPERKSKVLEIGTGSGFQTAFLAEFSKEVYTVEKIGELAESAKARLLKLGYKNISFLVGDGSKGWEEHAPYDRIIVTAGAGSIPDPLLRQLAPGGRMVIPVGIKGRQELLLITKNHEGVIQKEYLGEVTFVELKGEYGWMQ